MSEHVIGPLSRLRGIADISGALYPSMPADIRAVLEFIEAYRRYSKAVHSLEDSDLLLVDVEVALAKVLDGAYSD